MDSILFFSVSHGLKIDGVEYRPSICYPVPPFAKKALEEYEAKGKVKFWNKPVRFVNGKAIEIIPNAPRTNMVSGNTAMGEKSAELLKSELLADTVKKVSKRKREKSWDPNF